MLALVLSCCTSRERTDTLPIPEDETLPTPAPPAAQHVPQLNHLVLNMDVNKTIIMTDAVAGKKAENVVNEVLADAAWGVDRDGAWVLCSAQPCTMRPCEAVDGQSMLSYAEWLQKQYPGKEGRKTRAAINGKFTHAGQPGETFASQARTMLGALKASDGSDARLIPAFFELLATLKLQKRSFSLCFRTFGEDLVDVAEELNAFCEGRHYLFPGVRMDGSDGEADYRLHLEDMEQWGTFHRDIENGNLSLILGTLEQPGEGKHRDATDKRISFYDGLPGVHKIISGMDAVRDFLREKTNRSCTVAVRDYFQYWKHKNNVSSGGKVFFFNRNSDVHCNVTRHDVFFDDNIRFSDAYIVNPIDIRRPDRAPWIVGLLQTHLCRAQPLEAIFDRQYFVKEVTRLEAGYERSCRAQRRLRGLLMMVHVCGAFRFHEASSVELEQEESYDSWKDLRKVDNDISLALDEEEELLAGR